MAAELSPKRLDSDDNLYFTAEQYNEALLLFCPSVGVRL